MSRAAPSFAVIGRGHEGRVLHRRQVPGAGGRRCAPAPSSWTPATSSAAGAENTEGKQTEQLIEQERDNMDLAGDGMQAQNGPAGDGDETDPTRYYENRLRMLGALRSTGVDPYLHKFDARISIADYVAKYNSLGVGEHLLTVTESLAGRVMSKRAASSFSPH